MQFVYQRLHSRRRSLRLCWLAQYVREGDTVFVYAVDRLGRDALDVQATVRALLDKGVSVSRSGASLDVPLPVPR